MNNFSFLLTFLLIACSPSSENSKNEGSSGGGDFSGYLEMTIEGETYKFDDLTRSNSRVSFQEEAIAVYVEVPGGEGTLAQITLLSSGIYDATSHSYTNESGRWVDNNNQTDQQIRQNLNFKFRRIDNMDEERYLNLDVGKADVEYDDENGDFKVTFEGEDRPSSYNNKDNDLIKFSGTLVLEGAYLMDSRD